MTPKSSKNVFFEQKIRENARKHELAWDREVVDGSKFFKKITEDDPTKIFFEKKFFRPKIQNNRFLTFFEQKISKNACHDELVLGREVVDSSKFFKKITEDDPTKIFFEKKFFRPKIQNNRFLTFFEQKISKNACHDELVLGREVVDGSKFFKKITEDDPIKNFVEKNFFDQKNQKTWFLAKNGKKIENFQKFSKKNFFRNRFRIVQIAF